MIAAAVATAFVASLAKGVFAVPCTSTCYYELKSEMSWTQERHPTDFPMMTDSTPEAFFPNFWTVAHDDSFYLWRDGELANAGIQEIAELGSGEAFMEEVQDCGDSCGMAEGFPCEPMGGTCKVEGGLVKVTYEKSYVSTATMLAPSPDWFTGLDSVELCEDGEWVEYYEREVFPYDSGTDSGETFLAVDSVTSPPEPISRFGPEDMGIFYNPEERATLPIGKIGLHLVSCDDMMMGDKGTYGYGDDM